jgi:hypothetical protein
MKKQYISITFINSKQTHLDFYCSQEQGSFDITKLIEALKLTESLKFYYASLIMFQACQNFLPKDK